MSLVIRSDVPPLSLVGVVRQTVHEFNPSLSIAKIRTMDEIVRRSTSTDSFLATLLLLAATVSVFLSAIGVYSVAAHTVRRQEREIGIRIALGADPDRLVGMLLKESVVFVLAGSAAGLAAAFAGMRALRAFLFEVSVGDPLTFAIASILLIGVGLIAGLVPARRAVGAQSVISLRGD